MSSIDSMDLRPKLPWRIAILIAAIACLGLTMCVRSEQKRAPAKPAAQTTQQAPQQQQAPQPPPKPPEKPEYFNATKAPGGMYR